MSKVVWYLILEELGKSNIGPSVGALERPETEAAWGAWVLNQLVCIGKVPSWATWVAQSINPPKKKKKKNPPSPGFSLDQDLRILGSSSALCREVSASPSVLLPLLLLLLSLLLK